MSTSEQHDWGEPASQRGQIIESETQPGVTYHLEALIGEGGMGNAYLARRQGKEGSSPVVVKIMSLGFGGGAVAPWLVATKEAVALGRLNESVPPTPFVVRLVDAGSWEQAGRRRRHWTAIEYVHGGVEGTTLEDRVTYSVHKTGYAFDAIRAAHALRCLTSGLSAIHAAGVLHRDITPGNVLCCGFGGSEIFKIADFGIARASGLDATFAGITLGTLGYTAPDSSSATAGAQSDVFSLAGVLFYLLTGRHLFEASSLVDVVRLIAGPSRQSITGHPTLSPDLVDHPSACEAIDAVIARATSIHMAQRPATPQALAAALLPWLGEQQGGPRSSTRLRSAVLSSVRSTPSPDRYSWTVRSHPRSDIILLSTAWDTDGHAFALSGEGARFWNGSEWIDAARVLGMLPPGMTFTQRYEAGGWLVGGDSPTLSVIDARGVSARVEAPMADTSFWLASGRIDDLLTAVGRRPGQPPTLFALSSRRWLKPITLEGVAHVATLQRLDDVRWLIGGRRLDGKGFAAVYSPMQLEVEMIPVPPLRSFIGGASVPERTLALLAGSGGVVLRFEGESATTALVPGGADLAAAAVDIFDREWTTSLGVIYGRDQRQGEPFRPLWANPTWTAPFVSVMADAGMVVAMTADGGVVEGRAAATPLRR